MPEAEANALVVDDDALIQMHACEILEQAGFACLSADDGDQAWRDLAHTAAGITLLFSDVEMPGEINGFELARRVAATYPHIEVVLASGRVSPGDNDLPGKTTFIPKPFSAAIVHEHLRAILPEEEMPAPLREGA